MDAGNPKDIRIHDQIDALVAEEHKLRAQPDPDRARLRELEETLDQAWDLLRRRDALRDAGRNPDEAQPASVNQVEGYLQ